MIMYDMLRNEDVDGQTYIYMHAFIHTCIYAGFQVLRLGRGFVPDSFLVDGAMQV